MGGFVGVCFRVILVVLLNWFPGLRSWVFLVSVGFAVIFPGLETL